MLSPISLAFADAGLVIKFLVQDGDFDISQESLVQDGKMMISSAGGDPDKDALYDADLQTLYIINHAERSYYRIDQSVIDKAASIVESIAAVAESQRKVITDMLTMLSISTQESEYTPEQPAEIINTKELRTVANIVCLLYKQLRNGELEAELCMTSREKLSIMDKNYMTLESFYLFGSQLISRAGSILQNMGFLSPHLESPDLDGLPILIHMVSKQQKFSLVSVDQFDLPVSSFEIPAGYVQAAIPFIG